MSHTPGPWRVENADTVVSPAGNVVAECCGYSVQATDKSQQAQGGRESNARLIAAAPELLAAMQAACDRELADAPRHNDRPHVAPWYDAARAAISKALGQVAAQV